MVRTLSALILLFFGIAALAQPKKANEPAVTIAALKLLGGALVEIDRFELSETGAIVTDSKKKIDPTTSQVNVLRFTNADDKVLAKFPKSDAALGIDLTKTKVTNAGLKTLPNLKGLQMLSLHGVGGIDDDGLRELFLCKDLRLLDLAGTRVTTDGLRQIDQLKDLQALDLSRCRRVTDSSVRDLCF